MQKRIFYPQSIQFFIVATLAACGGGDGDSAGSGGAAPPLNAITLAGKVAKGPVVGATVNVYALTATGQKGDLVAKAKHQPKRDYQIALDRSVLANAYLLEADLSGASIYDEVSKSYLKGKPGETLTAAVVIMPTTETITANVTPFSTVATEFAKSFPPIRD